MNIQTLTSPKPYNNSYLNVCPDDVGLLRYSSSPVKSPSPPSMVYSSSPPLSNQHQLIQPQTQNNNNNDLQSVISKYHANPELLKLILASKVEEDKRRTEEAKLKAKELDLYIQKQQEKKKEPTTNRNSLQQQSDEGRRRRSSCSSTSSSGSITADTISSVDSIHRRIAPYAILRPIAISNTNLPRRNSSIGNSSSSSSSSSSNTQQQYHHQHRQQKIDMDTLAPSSSPQYLPPPPPASPSSIRWSADNKIKNSSMTPPVTVKSLRKRRSMQAITKIVETTEYPYEDGHFWKNNGNTIQKKTGCKSVYYKCANSSKGCPVNKTVIEQPDGNYLIKYRGDHIYECSQVEYIRDL